MSFWRRKSDPALLELPVGSARLRLRAGKLHWSQLSLDVRGVRHLLGADDWSIVVDRLLRSLRADVHEPDCGTIDGVGITWVLSLFERHATIYTAHCDGVRILYFQDAFGNQIARLELDDEQRRLSIALLEAASGPQN